MTFVCPTSGMPRKGTLPAGISEESLRGAPSLTTALKQVGKCKAMFAAGPPIVNTGSHLSMLYYTRAHMRSDYIVCQEKIFANFAICSH